MESFIKNSRKIFLQYKELGDKAMTQVKDKDLFIEPAPGINSIAIIVQHLHGNMLSRWTDFLTSDGEKEWRRRDEEFEPIVENKTALMALWEAGWAVVFKAMESLHEDDLHRTIYIRNQPLSVLDAIQRQLTHYAYHVGQIVYLGKMAKGEDWQSLSIARGGSKKYHEGLK